MTDDQRLRSLLTLAAELPDDVQPPVGQLLGRSRSRRRIRAACSVLGAAAVAAAAFTLPPVARSLGHPPSRPKISSGLFPATPSRQQPGPSAAQLSRYHWSTMPPSPLGPLSRPILAWTGSELLELGGLSRGVPNFRGAAFTPATGSWHAIAPAPTPIVLGKTGLADAITVWTGRLLFVTTGKIPPDWAPGAGAPAGLYVPARNQWHHTLMPAALLGARQLTAVWTGRVIVVAGVQRGRVIAAVFTPATNRWRLISPPLPARHPARYIAMLATANRLILWSFWDHIRVTKRSLSDYAGADVLALGRAGAWHVITGRYRQNMLAVDPIFTGATIILPPVTTWCGSRCSPPGSGPGYVVDPLSWAAKAIPVGPLGYQAPAYVWTGRAIVAVDVDAEISGPGSRRIRPDDMAAWDPATGRWRSLPATPGLPVLALPPVWAGSQLFELTATGGLLFFHS